MLKIGADPEVFVRHGANFVSGHIFPVGTKEKPQQLKTGGVQNDGMALEFNVIPSTNRQDFVRNTISVFKELNAIVKAKGNDYSIAVIPTAPFGAEYIRQMPKHVSELGCSPDYSAYTGMANPIPNRDLPFRTGSGHVHVGFCEPMIDNEMHPDHFAACQKLSKELDYFLGLPSLLWDDDNNRRQLYGAPGAFRPKKYGMEYRVLSNAWLRNKETMGFVFDQTVKAVESVFNGRKKPLHEKYGDLAKDLINLGDVRWADNHQKVAHGVFHNA